MTSAPTDVLTLRLDEPTQVHFDRLRTLHFPPKRNLIGAHLTLFHTLPEESWVADTLHGVCTHIQPFPVEVTGLRALGRGVAYTLASADLLRLHATLAAAFTDALSPQDRQGFQPHIVVQNKVTPETARALLAELRPRFMPWAGEAVGVDLWRYLGGPWAHRATILFPKN